MSLKFPPFLEFLRSFNLSKEERLINGIEIEKETSKMKQKLLWDTMFMEHEDKIFHGKEKKRWIDNTLKNLGDFKYYERELLEDLKSYIDIIYGTAPRTEKAPDIFRNFKAFEFFKETLKEFNALDRQGRLKEPYQPTLDAIRKSKPYKANILKYGTGLGAYISALNSLFKVNMNESKISNGDHLVDEITNYFNRNFTSE